LRENINLAQVMEPVTAGMAKAPILSILRLPVERLGHLAKRELIFVRTLCRIRAKKFCSKNVQDAVHFRKLMLLAVGCISSCGCISEPLSKHQRQNMQSEYVAVFGKAPAGGKICSVI